MSIITYKKKCKLRLQQDTVFFFKLATNKNFNNTLHWQAYGGNRHAVAWFSGAKTNTNTIQEGLAISTEFRRNFL